MTTEEKINQLEAVFKAQIDELRKEVKPKFEVGKWYWIKHTSPKDYWYKKGALICYQGNSIDQLHYGFNFIHEYINDFGNVWQTTGTETVTPATDKEVEEALIKEAERRGFKKGVRFKDMYSEIELRNGIFLYNCSDYGTCLIDNSKSSGNYIFWDGKWAEIIKDEPIKVGGYEVKKVVERDGCYYKIGSKKIADTSVGSLNIIMKSYNFKKVAFDGIEVDLETIEKILKL